MADSDDDYDRKRRDKFRGERAEASYRGTDRVSRPRDDWAERDSWSRPRPREYRSNIRDRGYSPSLESAPKRMRHDYYGDNYYNHYNMPYHQSSHRAAGNFFRESTSSTQSEGQQQPPMMSFKSFLVTQDDNISDKEAIEKYNDYKLEFQRQQLNEFFVAHKDDEWFRLKYHPEESVKRKQEQMTALKKRVDVFLELVNNGKINAVSIDCSKTNDLLKLLDTVVIKLEDGTDDDLLMLEQEYTDFEETNQNEPKALPKDDNNSKVDEVLNESEATKKVDEKDQENQTNGKSSEQTEEGEIDNDIKIISSKKQNEEEKQEQVTNENNESKMEIEEVDEKKNNDESAVVAVEAVEKKEDDEKETVKDDVKKVEEEVTTEETTEEKKKEKNVYSGGSSSAGSTSGRDSDDEKDEANVKKGDGDDVDDTVKKVEVDEEVKQQDEEDLKDIKIDTVSSTDDKPEKPKALHKTTSIFLRNLSPTITKQEVEAVCARFDGFLRVALADPQPERRWLRRGWVTFKRDSNIKEICWSLNNIRLRDCELGAIVNRDLSRRIRPVNGITAHKQVVRSDIRIAAKVTLHLDNKAGLWLDENNKEKSQPTFGLMSNNPILHNITDYLIEEASAEEEELLGLEPSTDTQDTASSVERDDNLITVLDRIILYLRVVHSVDYYNHCEYPNEDEMPNRCGILHARGPPPNTKVTDITQFIGQPIETKMVNFLPEKVQDENINETKLLNLSLKDVDTEIDKFVQANTRELSKDKWLCPLSGKKFKGPDFVRKHIFNKHAEKIEEVKKEVEFFNNYLKDHKRPMLQEAPQSKREEPPVYNHPPRYGNSFGNYGRPPPYYNQGYAQRSRGYTPRTRGTPSDFRPVIHYRDLDAPREPEEFI